MKMLTRIWRMTSHMLPLMVPNRRFPGFFFSLVVWLRLFSWTARSTCPLYRYPSDGSSTDLQGRGNSSHHQYSARGSQHPHLVQSRRPSHRGYCQWVTHVGGKPVSSRYHLGIAPHQVRWAQVTGRKTLAGAALQDARRTKERTYPELIRNRRCRLVVWGIEVGGRWSNEASSFIQPRHLLWCPAGLLSLPMQQPLLSLPAFCLKIFPPTTTFTEIFHPYANSSQTRPAVPTSRLPAR